MSAPLWVQRIRADFPVVIMRRSELRRRERNGFDLGLDYGRAGGEAPRRETPPALDQR